ncbi:MULTISPECIES: cystathionine beta-synthase [Micrococcaceae]|uniref:cystathionine beta-synthase n=1 Tax=Micrococcaceae TaxID=1268 RepID=UPI001617AC75|nr:MULTISPECIES: cystathionine beta-synthase [Micrococcaceae]HRO29949.1 cystathionine beta-synthase [Citricoccus sp.]HRO93283.1 cystathionine beta-synthase [Citricoccus sp.]
MHYAENVLGLIGNTPLVKLNRVTEGISATVLVKPEYLNPGGSVKDRIALAMIENAEAEGKLAAGGTVVEPTSGNTGVGLALVAQLKGYHSVFVTPDKVGQEKRDVLRAYGAEVVVTKTSVAPESEESYYGVANRLERDIPGAYQPNQFFNPSAPQSHYQTTGPEIWRDTAGRLTHVVIGAGTGGTVTGTGRYLKEVSAGRASGPVKVVVADPDGSIYSGGTGRPYFVEGVGEDMMPGNYDPSVPDEVIAVDDAASFEMTRRLAAEEGLLVGGSSGMAVVAGLQAARDLGEDDVMVIILPDSGRGYLGKIFNDGWMDEQGFETAPAESVLPAGGVPGGVPDVGAATAPGAAGGAPTGHWEGTVKDLLAAKSSVLPGSLPDVVTAPKDATLADAISTMNRFGVDALPVVSAPRDDLRVGEVLGAVDVGALTDLLASGRALPTDAVLDHAGPALPKVNVHATLAQAREALRTAPALMATHHGVVTGIVTLHDLLARVAR